MDESTYWKAIEARDTTFDGTFVFGVVTTKIYCRPSCTAKRAKKVNVRFFLNASEAEQNGFRSCLRCRPAAERHAGGSEFVVDIVDGAVEGATRELREVAERKGLTAAHLDRKFKKAVGVSRKRFEEARKIEQFKKELGSGGAVTDSLYAAGYSSSSRLYERADERLGMTPAVYKRGGRGVAISFAVTDCEFGKMLAARTQRGICCVTFGDSEAELEAALFAEFPNAEIERDDSGLAYVVDEIIERLGGRLRSVDLPLDIQSTAFQIQVWDELSKIPYGETRSYSQVAEKLGDRKKVRAVARACATNQVAILIPCHRVIAVDGKLAGYRWGIERKRRLLEKERCK